MNSRLCISAPKLRTQHCIGSNEHIVGAEIGFGPGSPGAVNVAVGSWLCENALAEALTNRDFGELTVFGHLAVFGGLFCLESS